jgi:hypothetical protein
MKGPPRRTREPAPLFTYPGLPYTGVVPAPAETRATNVAATPPRVGAGFPAPFVGRAPAGTHATNAATPPRVEVGGPAHATDAPASPSRVDVGVRVQVVIPAQAGTHATEAAPSPPWTPAVAGMTVLVPQHRRMGPLFSGLSDQFWSGAGRPSSGSEVRLGGSGSARSARLGSGSPRAFALSVCPSRQGTLAHGPCDPGSPRAARQSFGGRTESQLSPWHARIVAERREAKVNGEPQTPRALPRSAAGPGQPRARLASRRPPWR